MTRLWFSFWSWGSTTLHILYVSLVKHIWFRSSAPSMNWTWSHTIQATTISTIFNSQHRWRQMSFFSSKHGPYFCVSLFSLLAPWTSFRFVSLLDNHPHLSVPHLSPYFNSPLVFMSLSGIACVMWCLDVSFLCLWIIINNHSPTHIFFLNSRINKYPFLD